MTSPILHVAVTGSAPAGDEQRGRLAIEAAGWLLAPGFEQHHLVDVRHDGEYGVAELLSQADRSLTNITVSEVGDLWVSSSAHASHLDLALALPRHKATESGSEETWLKAQLMREHGVPVVVVWRDRIYPFGDRAAALIHSQAGRRQILIDPHGGVGIRDIGTPF